uniref:Putative ribosomal protein l20 n=1 Tax=Ornithodoros turicata TaxID=34597 RepID=A0A2R5LGB2_9ACAR
MVFLTVANLVRNTGSGNKYWKRKRILQLSAHFYGRSRNCYRLAIRSVHRALQHACQGRKAVKVERSQLWETRINAASTELGLACGPLLTNLSKCKVAIDRRVLSDLAYTEPRTFKSLVGLARMKRFLEPAGPKAALEKPPDGIITRGML